MKPQFKLTDHEASVLGHYLTECDDTMTLDQHFEAVRSGEISIWEPFEFWPLDDLIKLIREESHYGRE
jgi:hypothetical protein